MVNDENNVNARSPKISIVIPTRERSRTLIHTLRTCTDQTYAPLEIIVSDNFSQDDTKEVVASFRDPRIKYINTGKRISMSHNWEFALDYVTGDFVTYVGDDDGLMPEAILDLVEIIARTNTKAISWRWASYYWPDCINELSRDLLILPLRGGLEKRSTKEILERVFDFECGYEELPFLYKGIISKQVIDEIRSLSGGVFFQSVNPDMYSAVAISAVLDDYFYSTVPFSLNGTSSHSNGASQFNLDVSSEEANQFNSENNIPFHEDLVMAPSVPILLAECFLQAREHLESLRVYSFDMTKMISAAHKDVRNASEWRYQVVKAAVAEIAKRNGLDEVAVKLFGSRVSPRLNQRTPIGLTPGVNMYHKQVVVMCAPLEVSNIYGASVLCGILLNRRMAHLQWSITDMIGTTFAIFVGVIIRKFSSINWKSL
jgi:hypothetical protein